MTGFLAAAALWGSGAFIFRNYLRLEIEEAWMAAGLCFFAQACWVVVLLGHLNALYPVPVAIAEILILSAQAAAILAWRFKGDEVIKGCLTREAVERGGEGKWFLRIAAFAFALILAARLLMAWALPINGYDALTYHMTQSFSWVRHGNLSLVSFPLIGRYFTRNGELFAAWLSEMAGARIEAARAYQCLALPLLGLAAAAIARRLSGREWMWPCALAVMAMPIAVIQAGTAYVDLQHAAFWLCAAASILCFERTGLKIHLSLYALALGLSAGTKSTIYFEAALLIPLAWVYWKRPPLRRVILRMLPLLLALAFLGGGLTYARNLLRTGNPIYPVEFRIGHWTVFHGFFTEKSVAGLNTTVYLPERKMMLWYPFRETQVGKIACSAAIGCGPLFGIGWLFLPLMFWTAWKTRDHGALAFLSLCPAVVFSFLFLHPYPIMRFVIFLPPILILGLAYVLSQTEKSRKRWIISGWSLAVIWCGMGAFSGFGGDAVWLRRELASHGRIDPYDFYVREYEALGEAWKFLGPRLKPRDVVATNFAWMPTLPWAGEPPRAELTVIPWGPSVYPDMPNIATNAQWMAQIKRLHVRYFGIVMLNDARFPWARNKGADEVAAAQKFPRLFKRLGQWTAPNPGQSALARRVVLFEVLAH